jgi:hypothetical protein
VCAPLHPYRDLFLFCRKIIFSRTHAAVVLYEPARCILQNFPLGRDAQVEIEQAAEQAQEFAAVSN